MSKIDKIHKLLHKKNVATAKINGLQNDIKEYRQNISDICNSFTKEEKEFINDKIIEAFTESQKTHLMSYRNYIEQMRNGALNSYLAFYDVFDPYYDDYTIDRIEETDGKLCITVSPTKISGSVSAMYTYHNIYNTVWFDKKEFENISHVN